MGFSRRLRCLIKSAFLSILLSTFNSQSSCPSRR
jgi:hypothetical protein